MTTKRIGKWVIVLFLLAALPGMTAVMAQEEGAPSKDAILAPAVEIGETITPFPWRNDESIESNDTMDGPGVRGMGWSWVYGGTIESAGDVDYWVIPAEDFIGENIENSQGYLFNIDARSFGSPLDSLMCLYSDDVVELACNDDSQGSSNRDSLLYYNLEADRSYYLKIWNFDYAGGSDYRYQLQVTRPLLISAAAANLGTGANVAGIPIQSGDVLAWSEVNQYNNGFITHEKWVMLLDLSDLGVKGNLVNLSAGWVNSGKLLVSFANNVTLPGITGQVNPWQVVVFDPLQLGPTTVGTFQWWWNGKQQGLTTTGEKPDAIDWPDWNGTTRLAVSTGGAASVPGPSGVLKLADEDVGVWTIDSGTWSRQFDGAGWHDLPLSGHEANWGLGARDVTAYAATVEYWGADFYEDFFIVLQGAGAFTYYIRDYGYPYQATVPYSQKDIIRIHDLDLEGWTELDTYVWWHGPDHGWNYNIDAIHLSHIYYIW